MELRFKDLRWKFTATLLFLFPLLVSAQLQPLSFQWQQNIDLKAYGDRQMHVGDVLAVTVSQKNGSSLDSAQVAQFLANSQVRILAPDSSVKQQETSLQQLLKNKGIAPASVVKKAGNWEISGFRLSDYIINYQAGDLILFHPYLGGAANVPAVPEDLALTITVLPPIGDDVVEHGNQPDHDKKGPPKKGGKPYTDDCDGCTDFPGDLIYDFKCKRLLQVTGTEEAPEYYEIRDLSNIKIKAQELVRVKIVNLNRYLYNVNLSVADSVYSSEVPALFSQFFGGASNFGTTAVQQGGANLFQGKEISEDTKKDYKDSIDRLIGLVRDFREEYNQLLDDQLDAYLLCDTPKCCGEQDIQKFSQYANKLGEINELIATIQAKYAVDMPSAADAKTASDAITKKLAACAVATKPTGAVKPAAPANAKGQKPKNAKNPVKSNQPAQPTKPANPPKGAAAAADSAAKKGVAPPNKDSAVSKPGAAASKNDSIAAKQGAPAAKNDSAAAKQAAAPPKAGADSSATDSCAPKMQEQLKANLKSLASQGSLLTQLDSLKAHLPTLNDLRMLFLFDRNVLRQNWVYIFPPIYPQGDRLHLTLDIHSRDTAIGKLMGYLPAYHDQMNLEFSVRNKTTFGFSTGPFFAFGSNVQQTEYGWQSVPSSGNTVTSTSGNRLISTGLSPAPFGIASYAHIGVKTTRNFGFGLSLGGGIILSPDILPAVMGGVSVSFGDRQRLNLNFGVGGFQVKVLQQQLYTGNVYAQEPTLQYDHKMELGFYAGVSFSLFTSTSKVNILSGSKASKTSNQ